MTSEKWQQVKQICGAALELEPELRSAFLIEACQDDSETRREVEVLLASFDSQFLEQPVIDQAAEQIINRQFAAGQKFGHYEIIRQIGAGGQGAVYLAEDARLNRRVALKVLPAASASDREANQRLWREARAAAALEHPHICAIYEIAESEGCNFIVMQYVEGETLASRLKREKLSVREILDLAIQVADALANAHSHHVIHRDIKPANIIVNNQGQAKILDFGLAKFIAEKLNVESEAETAQLLSAANMIIGTVPYMSPEQVCGKPLDERTDIFSFGVLLYEMLSGKPLFSRESSAETVSAILNYEPPIAKTLADAPKELQRIVRKALMKNRDERYQTAKDLLVDLKKLQKRLEFEAEFEVPSGGFKPGEAQTVILSPAITDEQKTLAGIAKTDEQTSQADRPKAKQQWRLFGLLAFVLLTSAFFAYRYFTPNNKQIESIAVMPFINESGNADTEYLSDGMTETLISSLSQLPNLNVKARSSVFRYKGKETNAQTIGKELNVQAILLGRVVQRGDGLTLSLELIDAQTENVIWSERYNRKQADLVSLQSEIALDVSSKLKTKLSGADEQRVAKTYTANPEAYRLYLQGRFYWNKREEKEFRKAVEFFNQAVALDPNYAPAYAGLADTYALLSSYSLIPSTEGMPKAREFARRALSLDNSLAEPHTTLAYVLKTFDYDFAGAEREFKRAIELNPNYATAHQWYGELLTNLGRFDEAAAEYRRGLEIDPLLLSLNWDFGRFLYMSRRYTEAFAQLKKTIELDPGFARAHRTFGELYRIKGDYANAMEEYAKFYELRGEPQKAALLRESFAKGGWNRCLRLVTAENSPLKEGNWMLARAYVELGEKDKALAELNKAYENRNPGLGWLKVEPQLDPLRDDPRFQDLLRRMNFPQ